MADPVSLTRQDLDPDALGILEDLYRRLDAHWEHKPMAQEPDSVVPQWAAKSLKCIALVKAGTFGKDSKLPEDWLTAHAPNPLHHHPFATWEEVRAFVLHAADAMLADGSYRIGSHFFPTTMDAWFLTAPPRKPRWSCFLRYANKSRALEPLDLDTLAGHDAKVQRIRQQMGSEAVEAVDKALRGVDRGKAPCFPGTSWERAGKLWAWWKSKGSATRNQFGDHLDRPVILRHTEKWDRVAGTFGDLMDAVVQWSREQGAWAGWIPVPGLEEWGRMSEWVAARHGAYLWIVPGSGGDTGRRELASWERDFVSLDT